MRVWGRNTRLAVGVALALALPTAPAQSQQTGSITGTVMDAEGGRTLESAQVYIRALGIGGLSNQQGRFLLLGVPAGTHEVTVEIIGYASSTESVTVTAGQTTTVEFRLGSTALRLQELVVTGVAGETPRVKLPFTVERVDLTDMPVPSPSAEGLIQGKVAGAKVVRGSGKPGDAADIMLRGPTSITGTQNPLIIVDGIITDNTLADIDALDVESVEIVKGAAAASLFGSRASNGVIQIRTKRGANLRIDQSRITVRNEYGFSSLEGKIGLSKNHPYRMVSGQFVDKDGNVIDFNDADSGTPVLDDGGTPDDAFQDNPYPGQLYDQLERFFDPGESYSNYVAVEGRTGSTNYRASFSNAKETGVVDGNDGFDRKTFRINIDHQVRDNFDVSLNTYYAKSHQDEMPGGSFFDITFMGPQIDLAARNPNDLNCPKGRELGGCLYINPDPRSNELNPLYAIENLDLNDDRQRFMASVDARWSPLTWFNLEGNYSIDRYDFNRSNMRPLGYLTDNNVRDDGQLVKRNDISNDINASITASLNHAFGDLTARTRLRWLLEDQHYENFSVTGNGFTVANVPVLDNISGEKSVSSQIEDVIAQGYFFITALDYQGKYVGDFLVRRDGSSLFGPDERWQTYYRAAAGWRMAQEDWWPIEAIDEFKLRYSIGTAGGRPRFAAQYETYNVSSGVITPVTLGNKELKPELATEQEFGLDMVFFGKVATQFTYAKTVVEDQLLDVPLPAPVGFTSQWQNAGTLESNTFEASIETAVIDNADMTWTTRLNYDRTRQEITALNRPAYRTGFFYVREGEPLGTYYGTRWATTCSELGAGADCSQYQVNDDGYLVWVGAGNSWQDGVSKSLWGTTGENGEKWGRPIAAQDADGNQFLRLGSTTPDFNLSWQNTFRWKNLSVSALFDSEWGADLYNQTRQWAYREWRHEEVDQAGKPDETKKPVAYYSDLYNTNANSSHFVEDGSYVKFRELSLRYTLDGDVLQRIGGGFGLESVSLNLVGRNLITWTDYSGYDPEVGSGGQGSDGGAVAIGRNDDYNYPNFRTITMVVELVF